MWRRSVRFGCPVSGKWQYSKSDAVRALNEILAREQQMVKAPRQRGLGTKVYRCPDCGRWHIGALEPWRTAGES